MKNFLKRDDPKSLTITAGVVIVAIGLSFGLSTHVSKSNADDAVRSEVTQVASIVTAWSEANGKEYDIPTNANSRAIQNEKAWSVISDADVSDDVTWVVSGSTDGFCIKGYHHKKGQYKPGSFLTYDSLDGGLDKSGGACAQLKDTVVGGSVVSAPVSFSSTNAASGQGSQSFDVVASAKAIDGEVTISFDNIGSNIGTYVVKQYSCTDGKVYGGSQEVGSDMVANQSGGTVGMTASCEVDTVTIAPSVFADDEAFNLVGEYTLKVTHDK